MKLSFIILGAILTIALIFLLCQDVGQDQPSPPPSGEANNTEQPRENSGGLQPGEVNDPRWPQPILVSVSDTVCRDQGLCPSKGADCVTKDFRVELDATYYLTLMYFNGDTLTPSCRACGTLFEGNRVIAHQFTACPTGGAWVTTARLVPYVTYTVSVCLRGCPDVDPPCKCGESAVADAIISMKRIFN